METVSFAEFKKLQIKTAKVLEVSVHPNADKLYVLRVDLGDKQKQLVAGIKNFYTPEQLVGKTVIVIDNLEPAVIRGVESQGMLLATKDDAGIVILIPERDVASGCSIT